MLSTAPFEVPAYLLDRVRGLTASPMAIAGAGHPVAMESARQAAEAGLIEPVLVGDPGVIRAIASDMGWDIAAYRIVAAKDEVQASETAAALASGGEVTSLMKGHVHTDAIMRAVLNRDAGLRTERRASHVFHMTVPGSERVLFITDGALNVAPDATTLLDIVGNAVGGTVSMDGNGDALFTPTADFTGAAAFDYRIDDGRGLWPRRGRGAGRVSSRLSLGLWRERQLRPRLWLP